MPCVLELMLMAVPLIHSELYLIRPLLYFILMICTFLYITLGNSVCYIKWNVIGWDGRISTILWVFQLTLWVRNFEATYRILNPD